MSWKERISRTLRKAPPDGLFLVAFVLMCCAYEYGRVLHLRPQPHHIWRQTIGLFITKNLYEGTATFWEPQIDAGSGIREKSLWYTQALPRRLLAWIPVHLTLLVPELIWPEPADQFTLGKLSAPGLEWPLAPGQLERRAPPL